MGLSRARVFETATFYAHFQILDDGQPAPAATVRVCDGPACAMAGAAELRRGLSEQTGSETPVLRGPCMGRCDLPPVAAVGHQHITEADAGAVAEALADDGPGAGTGPADGLKSYRDRGGMSMLRRCLGGERSFEEVAETLERSGLRGLGGAGFPSGMKWHYVRREDGPRHLTVNADEGEPGTFKDRHILLTDPYRFLEGVLIAAWAVEAADAYIYLRDEYPDIRQSLAVAIAEGEADGELGDVRLHLRRGAGAYICGEESAMLESLEGRRGLPRQKPPFPSQSGLFGRPTLIHNVETLYRAVDILEKGADWYQQAGRPHFYSVSGRVRRPGVIEAPSGITVRQLIDDYCGGMADGHVLKAYMPGGASGGILPAALDDLPLDFGTLEEHGCFIGSAAVVVLSERDDLAALVGELMRFFEDESCGQCTPCRVGTEKAAAMLDGDVWDIPTLERLCAAMSDASICGLGQAAPNPLRSLLKHFPEDVPGRTEP